MMTTLPLRPGSVRLMLIRDVDTGVIVDADVFFDGAAAGRARAALLVGLDGEFRDYAPESPLRPVPGADVNWAVADARRFLSGYPVPARELIERLLAIVTAAYAAAGPGVDSGPVAPSPWGDRPEPEDPDRDRMDDAELGGHQAHEPEPWS